MILHKCWKLQCMYQIFHLKVISARLCVLIFYFRLIPVTAIGIMPIYRRMTANHVCDQTQSVNYSKKFRANTSVLELRT